MEKNPDISSASTLYVQGGKLPATKQAIKNTFWWNLTPLLFASLTTRERRRKTLFGKVSSISHPPFQKPRGGGEGGTFLPPATPRHFRENGTRGGEEIWSQSQERERASKVFEASSSKHGGRDAEKGMNYE